MKTILFLFLLLSLTIKAQSPIEDITIPTNFIGQWRNQSGTDTITITSTTVEWFSNEHLPVISNIDQDQIIHNEPTECCFNTRPSVYTLNLRWISRNKMLFEAKATSEHLDRGSGIYLKVVR